MPYSLRRLLIGTPLATSRASHERINAPVGLAVFASDALSSVAYATEEILLALVLAGTAGVQYMLPVAVAISLLIWIVAFSYRQTIVRYPDGGGAYIVAKDNLGTSAGLIAGAALLVDYVLTVSVSVAAGVAAVASAFPDMVPYRVAIGVGVIAFVAIVNLRGTRESGLFFAGPTYVFIFSMLALIGWGILTSLRAPLPATFPPARLPEVVQPLTMFLILRSFASGCAAVTGIEAVANGVRAFKEPSAKRAATVMTVLATLSFTMFVGTSWLAHQYKILPDPSAHETVVSQIARQVFGGGALYYVIQIATAMILFLAANTSFADFPRLSSLVARDGYMPRQLANLGDRLVFSNGIIILGICAAVLIVIFHGSTHHLIPLYAVGVFLAFTMSQSGMVVRWWRKREPGWRAGMVINAIGALTTAVVLAIILMVKFVHGAWVVAVLLPLLIWQFRAIRKHYDGVARLLKLEKVEKVPVHPTTVIIPVAGLHKGVIRALRFAAGLQTPARAIHIAVDPDEAQKLQQQWSELHIDIPLEMVESPYRSLTGPLLEYVDRLLASDPDSFVAVIIPEFVPQHWRHAFLHNQSAILLSFALRSRPNAVLINVRLALAEEPSKPPMQEQPPPLMPQILGGPESADREPPPQLDDKENPPAQV